MNENIDLTKILDGCPMGTEFYHAMYGTVRFVCLDLDSKFPIKLSFRNNKTPNSVLTKWGTWNEDFDGECLLFPSKDQRDWSKFERFWDKQKVERFDPNTLQPFDRVLARNNTDENWNCDFFSHYDVDNTYPYLCIGYVWEQLIPYNDETKHLVGTKDDCPEYYKWWEE